MPGEIPPELRAELERQAASRPEQGANKEEASISEQGGIPAAEVVEGKRREAPEELRERKKQLVKKLVDFLTDGSVISAGHFTLKELAPPTEEVALSASEVDANMRLLLEEMYPDYDGAFLEDQIVKRWREAMRQWIRMKGEAGPEIAEQDRERIARKAEEQRGALTEQVKLWREATGAQRLIQDWDHTALFTWQIALDAIQEARRAGKKDVKLAYLWNSLMFPAGERKRRMEEKDPDGYPLAIPGGMRMLAKNAGIKPGEIIVLSESQLRDQAGELIGWERSRKGKKRLDSGEDLTLLGRQVEKMGPLRIVKDDRGRDIPVAAVTGTPNCKAMAGLETKVLLEHEKKYPAARLVQLWSKTELNCKAREHVRLQSATDQERVMEVYFQNMEPGSIQPPPYEGWSEPRIGV